MLILNIILEELDKQNKTQKDLCNYLHIKNQAFSDWKAGKSQSYKKYLPEIADFLNVDINQLLNKKVSQTSNNDELLSEIIEYYNQCDMIGKSDIYQYAKTRAEQCKLLRKDS